MADVLKGGVFRFRCNDKCGCPSPRPGGLACKRKSAKPSEYDHKKCSCGQQCSCNPCSCSKAVESRTGKVQPKLHMRRLCRLRQRRKMGCLANFVAALSTCTCLVYF